MCQNPACYEQATHLTGWGNQHELRLCVGHTRIRETLGAWSPRDREPAPMRRSPFDPVPVVADVLHLLAHPDELHVEPLTHCGTCSGSGRIVNPNTHRLVACHVCDGNGAT